MPNNTIHSDAYLAFFDKHGKKRPDHFPHGTQQEIEKNMKTLKTSNWRMEGPGKLIADTEQGRLVQYIGTDYICLGTNDEGLPILKKIV